MNTVQTTISPSRGVPSRPTGAPARSPGLSPRIGDVLLERRLITPEQLRQAVEAQKSSDTRQLLGEIVVQLGFCTEAQVIEALAHAYGVPFAQLTPRLTDPAVLKMLPREFIDGHAVLPLFFVDGTLTVAVTEPANVFLIEEISQRAGCPVQIVAATHGSIRATLDQHVPETEAFAIDDLAPEHDAEAAADPAGAPVSITASQTALSGPGAAGTEADSPVVKLVHHAILSAIRESASDIHVEPDDRSLRIRFRVDGRLVEKLHPPYQMQPAIVSRIKIMAGMDISERRLPQDGTVRVAVDGNSVDLRVSTLPNKFGEKVVLRIIDNRNVLVSLDRLGMSADIGRRFRHEIHKPHGIILVTGPTGSGKSATLYAALNEINHPGINICTVEDPVEFNLPGVNQFQVHEKIGFTFAAALRSLLRQDPDVIMLGEIRDTETARIAVQAALTGHLVLATLHTNDAPGAITRLRNLGVESYLISAALEAVVGQRLVRRICESCVHEIDPPPSLLHAAEKLGLRFESEPAPPGTVVDALPSDQSRGGAPRTPDLPPSTPEKGPPPGKILIGQGCSRCHQTGTKGRAGIFELLVPDDEMRDAITGQATLDTLRDLAVKKGMVPLLQAGLEAVRRGVTTFEEVLRVTNA